jgi:hypothetical protein
VRDRDGQLRRVAARGTTKARAVAALKAKLADREQSGAAGETVTADMPFAELARLLLEDIKIDPRLSDGAKAVYESELRTIRHSARSWRSGGVFPGPKPDGQLRESHWV